ncbi:MAG TPA: helix-turn-helix domain-containing protein [bacterium]|nr:helix-turn-helix domain-containing protein [bacterium]
MTKVVSTFSAKGGTGTSVMTVNLAVYLAQKGKKVLLVDAAPNGGTLHTYLNIPSWEVSRAVPDFFSILPLIDTDYPNLKFFSSLRSPQKGGNVSEYLVKWETELKKGAFDIMLIDMGSHLDHDLVATAQLSDFNILFVGADPVSIEKANYLFRLLFSTQLEALVQRLDFNSVLQNVQRTRSEFLFSARNLLLALSEEAPKMRRHFAEMVHRLRIGVVFNGVRTSADAELKDIYPLVIRNYYGFDLKSLGDVLFSDVFFSSSQGSAPMVVSERGGEFIEMLDTIAGRLLSLISKRDPLQSAPFLPLTYYEMLGVQRGSSAQDIRAQYEKLRAVYFSQSPLMREMFDTDNLFVYARLLESVYQNLMDPEIKREYDMSGGAVPETLEQSLPEGFDLREVIRKYQRQKKSAHKLIKRDVFGREADPVPGTEEPVERREVNELFERYRGRTLTGADLKAFREELGITLKMVAEKTRISQTLLQAIESDDPHRMPAPAYLKGFLKSYCRTLRLSDDNTERVVADIAERAVRPVAKEEGPTHA